MIYPVCVPLYLPPITVPVPSLSSLSTQSIPVINPVGPFIFLSFFLSEKFQLPLCRHSQAPQEETIPPPREEEIKETREELKHTSQKSASGNPRETKKKSLVLENRSEERGVRELRIWERPSVLSLIASLADLMWASREPLSVVVHAVLLGSGRTVTRLSQPRCMWSA